MSNEATETTTTSLSADQQQQAEMNQNAEAAESAESESAQAAGNAEAQPADQEVVVTAGELNALREQAAQAEAMRDRYLRSVAEFENFRKRSARDRQEAVQFAAQGLMEKLMPVLDNLDMALAAVSAPHAQTATAESLKTGVDMVLSQLRSVLREAGLEEIDAMGQMFDPTWHEAVSQQETADAPEGQVVQQIRKGYRLHQRLLRPAMVVVARPPQG
jgi:molecular chaperone GrpE